MRKLSKLVLLTSVLFCSASILAGCMEGSDSDIKTETVAEIGKNSSEVKVSEPEITGSEVSHDLRFGDKTIKVLSTYGIESKRLNNWTFTTSSTVHLGFEILEKPEDVEVMINNVYSEVSIISTKAYKNGIRQDSVNQSYSQVGFGGLSVDTTNDFTLPFQVEGINQNETSFWVINGYGSTSTDRLTEAEVRRNAQGGMLNTVWTIALKSRDSEQVFSKTINDKIGLPCRSSND